MAYYVITREKPDVEIVIAGNWARFEPPYYCEWFKVDLKGQTPSPYRHWDGRAWRVHVEYLDTLKTLVARDFNEPTIVRAELEEAA